MQLLLHLHSPKYVIKNEQLGIEMQFEETNDSCKTSFLLNVRYAQGI